MTQDVVGISASMRNQDDKKETILTKSAWIADLHGIIFTIQIKIPKNTF